MTLPGKLRAESAYILAQQFEDTSASEAHKSLKHNVETFVLSPTAGRQSVNTSTVSELQVEENGKDEAIEAMETQGIDGEQVDAKQKASSYKSKRLSELKLAKGK
jgi:hypothetical protein